MSSILDYGKGETQNFLLETNHWVTGREVLCKDLHQQVPTGKKHVALEQRLVPMSAYLGMGRRGSHSQPRVRISQEA